MDFQAAQPYTMCVSKAALAAGTTTTLSNTGTILFAIRGKAYSKAAMTNAATPTTDWGTLLPFVPVPANFGSVFLVGNDAAGNLRAVQGTVVPLDANGNFINAPQFGGAPLNFCAIGYLIVKAGATASSAPGWVFGTSNMSGVTGITYTFVDVMGLPDRPQIA